MLLLRVAELGPLCGKRQVPPGNFVIPGSARETTKRSAMDREKLADLVIRFTEAFNREDLDGVMSFMAADAVYDEFKAPINRAAPATRAAFVPQFRGDYGKLRFHTEDLFVDAAAGKALIR